MKTRVTIYFEDVRLKDHIEKYSKDRNLSFSQAVVQLAETGFDFYKYFHNRNVILIHDRFKDYQENIKFLRETVEKLTKEKETLKKAEQALEHQLHCQRIEIEKGKKAAIDFHRRWMEIREKEGDDAAFLFGLGHPYRSRK